MRPNIEGRAEEIIQLFLERGLYETQVDVIEAGLMLLLNKRLAEEAAIQDGFSAIDEDLVNLQLGGGDASDVTKVG
jgi:Arc/MetJ-type ribon-helix-helix transcriptional regulator